MIAHIYLCMQTKEQPFQSKACGEFAKLRTVQEELEREAQQACFLGCSVTETGTLCHCMLGDLRCYGCSVTKILKLCHCMVTESQRYGCSVTETGTQYSCMLGDMATLSQDSYAVQLHAR